MLHPAFGIRASGDLAVDIILKSKLQCLVQFEVTGSSEVLTGSKSCLFPSSLPNIMTNVRLEKLVNVHNLECVRREFRIWQPQPKKKKEISCR
jgi:hypothetical protein